MHQVWQPGPPEEPDDNVSDRGGNGVTETTSPPVLPDDGGRQGQQSGEATRITLRPHDPSTGEQVDKQEVVKGYEYQRGQFVTFTPEQLKALDVESSKVIDLEKFVPRGEIDPVYFESPYYLFPMARWRSKRCA